MRKAFKTLGILTVFLAVLISCDSTRDITGDGLVGYNYDGTEVPDSAIKLKVIKSTSDVLKDGTAITTNFNYNEADRLTTVVVNSPATGTDNFKLFYDEKTKVLSRIELDTQEAGQNIEVKYDLFYNAQKRLSAATGTATVGNNIIYQSEIEYTYNNNMLTNIAKTNKSGSTILDKYDVALDYEGNNVKHYTYTVTNGTANPIVKEYEMSDYDDKRNPYAGLLDSFKTFMTIYNYGNTGMLMHSRNNPKTIKINNANLDPLKYEYNQFGYPDKVTRNDNSFTNFVY